ncbi:MAG TPA: hypothetical protein VM096_16885 [Vicinamibacterales bacterium]|nr:hypothetical protein [Vicinamibacterales bacterium]
MRISVWLAPLFLFISISCSSKPSGPAMPPFDSSISVKDLMANVVDPTADEVWESVGTIMTKEGTFERAPQTDEEWTKIKGSAIAIIEVGNLLMIPARSGGNDEWNQRALDLIVQAKRVVQAIDKHDKQAVFDTGADMYDACVNCHKKFDPAIRDAK